MHHLTDSWRKVIFAVLVGSAAGTLSGTLFLPWQLAALVGWDFAALTFVTWSIVTTWRLDPQETADHAAREDPGRAAADILLLSAAVASLVAVAYVVVRSSHLSQVLFGIASVVVSWLAIHIVYMLVYARLYYANGDGGADFHQTGPPRFVDFAYLAFTVGMTYQVSDTELRSTPFRAAVLRHAMLSYLFGTVIVALVINLVAGVIR